MHEPTAPLSPAQEQLLVLEARRLVAFHEMLGAIGGLEAITWFVVDLGGTLGHFCGAEIVGLRVVEHRLQWAARNGVRPSMCFPLDGAGALMAVAQLAPLFVAVVQRRIAGDVPVVVLDHEGAPGLTWLHLLDRRPGRA